MNSAELVRLRWCLGELHASSSSSYSASSAASSSSSEATTTTATAASTSGFVDVQRVVADVSHMVLNEVPEDQIDLAISLLFPSEGNNGSGVLTFLERHRNEKEYEGAKALLLQFLSQLIERRPEEVGPFFVAIKDACIGAFSFEKSSKVKVATFEPLLHIISLSSARPSRSIESLQLRTLFTKYFTEYRHFESKLTSSVKHWLLQLYGVVAQYHTEAMRPEADELLKIYVRVLESEFVSKKSRQPDLLLIAGALKGVDSFLFVKEFADMTAGKKASDVLYQAMRMGICPPDNLNRYDVPRAALQLLGNHAALFKERMFAEVWNVYNDLKRMHLHKNGDLRKIASRSMESFLKQMSSVIASSSHLDRDKREMALKLFIVEFGDLLRDKENSMRRISIAIRGFGYLAKPCKELMKPQDLKELLNQLLATTNWVFSELNDQLDDTMHYLSSFLQAYAYLCEVFDADEIDRIIESLNQLVAITFVNFQKLSSRQKIPLFIAIVGIYFTLYQKSEALLQAFFSKTAYDTLILTCTDSLQGMAYGTSLPRKRTGRDDSDAAGEAEQDMPALAEHAYMEFMAYWRNIFNEGNLKQDYTGPDVTKEKKERFYVILYDTIVEAILRLMANLNLKVDEVPASSAAANPEADGTNLKNYLMTASFETQYFAQTVKDIQIFINLVDFCEIYFTYTRPDLFSRWMYVFGRQVITFSTVNPLISGFYKLFALCLQLAESLDFFEETDEMEISPGDDKREIQRATFLLFRKFIQEVSSRTQQYKGDLLASCLRLLLSIPKELIDIDALVGPMQATLRLGVSYTPMAIIGLSALEYWMEQIPEKVTPLLPKFLPLLNEYLFVSHDPSGNELEGPTASARNVRTSSSKRALSYFKLARKAQVAVNAPANEPILTVSQQQSIASVKELRIRILRFLGRIGGNNKSLLRELNLDKSDGKGIAWDTKPKILLELPFSDAKFPIYLDQILPRVVELAETSIDRKVKVGACELLHAIVIHMIASDGNNYANIYRQVFPVIFRLAIDVDQIVLQLFRPLSFQLIHWFTSYQAAALNDSKVLLEVIFEGVVHETNGVLRDFSANCVAEYLRWSFKHPQNVHVYSAEQVLEKIFAFAKHPDAIKRLGSSLCVNHMYRFFREESSLVDRFTLELTANQLFNLRLSTLDDIQIGTLEQAKTSIEHMKRIIGRKAKELGEKSKHRRTCQFQGVGYGVEKSYDISTLPQLVEWIFKETGRPEAEYAHVCMDLFCSFMRLDHSPLNPRQWVKERLDKFGKSFISDLYENEQLQIASSNNANVSVVSDTGSLEDSDMFHWMNQLMCTLDGYTWLLREHIVDVDILKESKIFGALVTFMRRYAFVCSSKPFLQEDKGDFKIMSSMSPMETFVFNAKKCTVITKTIFFVIELLRTSSATSLEYFQTNQNGFWSIFFDVVARTTLSPQLIGFDVNSTEIASKLPETLNELLSTFRTKVKKELLESFGQSLGSLLAIPKMNFSELSFQSKDVDVVHYAFLCKGFKLLYTHGFLRSGLHKVGKSQGTLMQLLFQKMSLTTNSTEPAIVAVTKDLLSFVLLDEAVEDSLLNSLVNKHGSAGADGGGSSFPSSSLSASSSSASSNRSIGEALLGQFREPICLHFASHFARFVDAFVKSNGHPALVEVLIGILDLLLGNKKYLGERISFLKVFTETGRLLSVLVNDCSLEMLLSVWKKVVKLDSKILGSDSNPEFRSVFCKVYCSQFLGRSVKLSTKIEALDLLPIFLRFGQMHDAGLCQSLKAQLNYIVTDQFPLTSRDYPLDSPQYNEYISALNILLTSLTITGSPEIFEILIMIACRESHHTMEDAITKGLMEFAQRVNSATGMQSLKFCYDIFQNDHHRLDQRCNVVHKIMLPMMSKLSNLTLTQFFSDYIREIVQTVEIPLEADMDALRRQLMVKICYFSFLELLFTRMTAAEVNSDTGAVVKAFVSNGSGSASTATGKELTQAVAKICHGVKSQTPKLTNAPEDISLRREYFSAAYNALAALVLCTQSKVQFYDEFLFRDNAAKGKLIWESIVDTSTQYQFEVELSARFVRNRMDEAQGSLDNSPALMRSSKRLKYLSSQYLADSSLSQSMNFLGGGQVLALDGSGGAEGSPSSSSPSASSSSSAAAQGSPANAAKVPTAFMTKLRATGLELEMDPINRNPCMVPIIRVLQRLHSELNVPKPGIANDPPIWMQSLLDKFLAYDTHVNVKLFIGKMIVDFPEAFEPYALHWWKPLANLIGRSSEYGGGINYYVHDLCEILLAWSTPKAKPSTPADGQSAAPDEPAWPLVQPSPTSGEDRDVASKLLNFLMENCYHANRSILRSNLEIIKGFIENWGSAITFSTSTIYREFSRTTNFEEKSNAAGIQLTGLLSANNLLPYDKTTSNGIGESEFYSKFADNLDFAAKEIYASAAEVCGMILYQFDVESKTSRHRAHMKAKLEEIIGNKIRSFVTKGALDRFIQCLHKIQLHFPAFCIDFSNQILFHLTKLPGEFKVQALEILCAIAGSIKELFAELRSLDLIGLIKHRDEATQLAVLKVLDAILKDLTAEEIRYFLRPLLETFAGHPSVQCRSKFFDILAWLYNEKRNVADISQLCRIQLLCGLTDPEGWLRRKLLSFWSRVLKEPTRSSSDRAAGAGAGKSDKTDKATDDRDQIISQLPKFFSVMYTPESEESYLNYSCYLLIDATRESSDFGLPVSQLGKKNVSAAFEPLPIDVAWYHHLTPMAPLFAQTPSLIANEAMDVDQLGVRATQMEEFSVTQTQEPDSSSESSLPSLSFFDATTGQTQGSTLLFSASKGNRRLGVSQTAGDRLGSEASLSAPHRVESRYARLHRRFVRSNADAQTLYSIRKAEQQKKRLEISQRLSKQARSHKVDMYRSYRIGELPDIEIKFKEILMPLQALAQQDVDIARQLFSAIALSVLEHPDRAHSDVDAVEYAKKVRYGIERIFTSSKGLSPPVISSLLRICFSDTFKFTGDKSEVISPKKIFRAGLGSSNFHLGILLLEKQIVEIESTPSDRTKYVGALEEVWSQLAQLYQSIGEVDVLQNICEKHLSKSKVTHDAITAELVGDYERALTTYLVGIRNGRESKTDSELWDGRALYCLEKLTRWDSLAKEMANVIYDEETKDLSLDDLWNDDFLQERQYFLKSFSKLTDEGPAMVDGNIHVVRWSDQNRNPIFTFVDEALKDPSRESVLETFFGVELSMLSVLRNDINRTQYYVKKCFENFLLRWSNLHPLAQTVRKSMLESLQSIIELEEFINSARVIGGKKSAVDILEDLTKSWRLRYPDSMDDASSVWDTLVFNRNEMLRQLLSSASSGNTNVGNELQKLSSNANGEFLLEMSVAAMKQHNWYVAERNLTRAAKHIYKKDGNADKHAFLVLKVAVLKSNFQMQWAESGKDYTNSLGHLFQTLHHLDQMEIQQSGKTNGYQQQVLCSLLRGKLYGILSNELSIGKIQEESLKAELSLKPRDSVLVFLLKRSFESYLAACQVANDKLSSVHLRNKAALRLAEHCDKALRLAEEGSRQHLNLSEAELARILQSYPLLVVQGVLNSMVRGSKEAHRLFPRLLQIVTAHKETEPEFIRIAQDVPSWYFIKWLPQIVPLLNVSTHSNVSRNAVEDILLRLSADYPNALRDPFNTSYRGQYDSAKLAQIREHLKNELHETFVKELGNLMEAEHIAKDWAEKHSSFTNMGDIQRSFKLLVQNLFSGPNASGAHKKRATAFQELRKYVEGEKNLAKDFWYKVKSMLSNIKSEHRDSASLADYSTFLAQFQHRNFDKFLEIPGQYSGDRKPAPQFHAKIASFGANLMVMKSMRKPKQLTVFGTDHSEYKFLVKGGEDLRLDQRIQQLFAFMNDVTTTKFKSSELLRPLRTYKVIPFTDSTGVIEWVGNTKTLKSVILDGASVEVAHEKLEPAENVAGRMKALHEIFNGTKSNDYLDSCFRRSAEKCQEHMENCYECFRDYRDVLVDLLRPAIFKMAASPEAFLAIRSRFARSLACVSIGSYILGIGDRHLDNFLVDMNCGELVAIDFGHAFGSATQFLPIPELVPFRLTKQLVDLFSPHGTGGLLDHTMVTFLSLLVNKKELLLNVMDVFLKDPLVEWQRFQLMEQKVLSTSQNPAPSVVLQPPPPASSSSSSASSSSSSPSSSSGGKTESSIEMYARRKLDIARAKLELKNPAEITFEEVKLNLHVQPYLRKKDGYKTFHDIIFGTNQRRSALKDANGVPTDRCSNIREQVDCLIEQATDPNILARAFVGWSPWL